MPADLFSADGTAETRSDTGTPEQFFEPVPVRIASGEKEKARDIIAAIRTLKAIEQQQRRATREERELLARFAGFGPVALSIFADPVTGQYKDGAWEAMGQELEALLTPEEFASAKRTTFNAFYTSPTVIATMHEAIGRLGLAPNGQVLEPLLCGRLHNGSCVAQAVMWRCSSYSLPFSGISYLYPFTPPASALAWLGQCGER